MFSFLKKKFTLIELIVVIAVLGILAAIVVPNVSNMRDEADIARIKSDTKSIQTVTDLYSAKNYNQVPSVVQPTLDKPEAVDFTKLYPKYIKKIPKNNLYYWVDYNHEVFVSTIDAPKNIVNTNGTLSWESNGKNFYIYEATGLLESSTQSLKLIGETNSTSMTGLVSNQKYLVQTIDMFGNETPKTGSKYTGYTGTVVSNPNLDTPNHAPTAIITVPNSIDTSTNVVFSYANSTDIDGDTIKSAEWKVDDIPILNPNQKFTQGTHKIELRVFDGKDWSLWITTTLTVIKSTFSDVIAKNNLTIFVDATLGNDTTGDGTELKPYKTTEKAFSVITDDSYTIILGEGDYNFATFTQQTPSTKNISIIGKSQKTRLLVSSGIYPNAVHLNPSKVTMEFYNLIWDGTNHSGTNYIGVNKNWSFNNVVFNNIPDSAYSYFLVGPDITLNINNCIKTGTGVAFLRTYINGSLPDAIVNVKNSYGSFTSGYVTTQSSWDKGGNIITMTPQVDANFNITSGSWKNAGIGTNLDGSVMNIGVYGGNYTWK